MTDEIIDTFEVKGYKIKIHKPILSKEERENENIKLIEKIKASIDSFKLI